MSGSTRPAATPPTGEPPRACDEDERPADEDSARSPTACRRRSGPRSSSATATTSTTKESAPRSARRPGRGPTGRVVRIRRLREGKDRMTCHAPAGPRFRETPRPEGCSTPPYDVVDTPLGELLVAATERGALRISSTRSSCRARRPRATRGPRVSVGAPVDPVRARARRVLRGSPACLRPRPSTSAGPGSSARVLHELARRPRSAQVATYGGLAEPRRRAEGGTGSRHDDEPQPDPDRPALPPGGRCERKPRRLRRRARPQGGRCSGWRSAALATVRRGSDHRGVTLLALVIKKHTGLRLARDRRGARSNRRTRAPTRCADAPGPARRPVRRRTSCIGAGFVLLVIATRWGHFH